MRMSLIALLTGMLMACSQGTGANTPDDAVPAQPLARDTSVHSPAVPVRGETSLARIHRRTPMDGERKAEGG